MDDVKITVSKLEATMPDRTDDEAERIIQQAAQKLSDEAMVLLARSGAFQKPQPTALRLTPSGGFEVVELRDDGSIIEPPKRCPKCGPVFACSEHIGN